MSTKRFFSDQVLYKLYGGPPDSAAPVQKYDVWAALGQKVNALFKLHYLDTTLPSGETIPENAMIATYEGNTVVSSGEKSYALLPVYPISLPMNMGIYLVYDPNFPDMPFIPMQKNMTALLRTDNLLSDIMGQISYTPGQDRITFNNDLTTLGIDEVTMELCIMDIADYSETQELPIPVDYEERIINELVAQFSPVQPETGTINPITSLGQQPTKK
jgi:hypothetical protein